MLKPFSALKYFSRNKKRTATVIVVLLLSVTAVSFIASLITSITIEAGNANLEPFRHVSLISPASSDAFIKEDVVSEVTSMNGVAKTYDTSLSQTMFNSLMGSTSVEVVVPYDISDISPMMSDLSLTLSDGRLPQAGDDYEIAMSQQLLQNKGLKVGDYIGSDVNDQEMLVGKYHIVGSFSGVAMIAFANKNPSLESLKQSGLAINQPIGLIVVPQSGQLDTLNAQLATISHQDASVMTYSMMSQEMSSQLASINALLFIIIFVVVLIISISVSALIYIVYMGRSEEFGILSAMGYRKSFVRNLVLKEIISLSIACWVCGYVLSYLVFQLINVTLLTPKGQTLAFFTLTGLLYTLLVPVLVTICATFPLLRRLRKWDTIEVIERRG